MTDPRIRTGHTPGILGEIVALHARYYSHQWRFGPAFEATVAAALADFLPRLGSRRNNIWHVDADGRPAASIAIDGEDLGEDIAHLRWFIVGDALRGRGIGSALLDTALTFCDAGPFSETHLWTFEGLDAARHLYESRGFVLSEEYIGDQWGKSVREQKFIRPRP